MPVDTVVATKVGEYWIDNSASTVVDHSFAVMRDSVKSSLSKLGKVDILQIHKATEDVISLPDIVELVSFARSVGIRSFGVSVGTVAAGVAALESGLFDWLQFPLNLQNTGMTDCLNRTIESGKRAIINRPFAMGLAASVEKERVSSMKYILSRIGSGQNIILTGTSSIDHLLENMRAFEIANGKLDPV